MRPAAFALLAIVGAGSEASAHGIEVRGALLADGRLEIRALYDDGGPAAGAAVRVFDDADTIHQGEADDAGRLVLEAPTRWPIWIEARHAGHRSLVKITVDDAGALQVVGGGATGVGPFDSKLFRVIAGCAAILAGAALIGKLLGMRRRRPRVDDSEESGGAP